MVETRKIYMSGGSSYIISLPKKWVLENNLKPGDSVFVFKKDNSLIIEAQPMSEEKRRYVSIKTSQAVSTNALERLIIAYYLNGYDEIKIILDSKDNLRFRDVVRRLPELLIGVEIVEDTDREILLEILLDEERIPTIKALKRINLIIRSMLHETFKIIKERNIELAKDVITREKEIDRLYFLVVRQLKNSELLEKMNIKHRDALGYRMVVKSMERIADHIENIARVQINLINKNIKPIEGCLSLVNMVSKVYEESTKAFFSRDIKTAELAFEDLEKFKIKHEEVSNMLFNKSMNVSEAILFKSFLDSLARIGSYSSDIAEIAINMSIEMS